MPTYIDIHDLPGVKASDVVGAQVDEEAGKVFCLVEAPDRDTAIRVHREAHGLEAQTLYQVEQGA